MQKSVTSEAKDKFWHLKWRKISHSKSIQQIRWCCWFES